MIAALKKPLGKIQNVPIESITADPRCQIRDALDQDHIDEMAAVLTDGGELRGDPPVVFQDGENTYLGDGFHRREAYLKTNYAIMPCEVRQGTIDDAILYANRDANFGHGSKLSPGAVRRKVEYHLNHEHWRHFSDGQIAKWVHCSRQFATRVRAASGNQLPLAEPPEWLPEDLRTKWVEVAQSGGEPRLYLRDEKMFLQDGRDNGENFRPDQTPTPRPPDRTVPPPTKKDIVNEIDRHRDTPDRHADQAIAKELHIPPEEVRRVRDEIESPEPTHNRSAPPPDDDEGSANDEDAPDQGEMDEWAMKLGEFTDRFRSWVECNPWLQYQFDMRADRPFRDFNKLLDAIEWTRKVISLSTPDQSCPECHGKGCVTCLGSGFMPQENYEEYMAAKR